MLKIFKLIGAFFTIGLIILVGIKSGFDIYVLRKYKKERNR